MKYLLDTHIILWALVNDARLSRKAKEIILDSGNSIYYSTISPWEVEIKNLKDPNFRLSGEQLIFLCDQNGLLNLSVQNEHIRELKNLNQPQVQHKDPFDKILLAQARQEGMILITHDSKFRQYSDHHLMIV
ncbi:MAG: type II toxin-antitoxin system VapC family toxin [Erysipelotrichaceae bacterium]|nr:type II toxin-antitoxin system VapC family toxin [Erysipelotrichaceae bacterium]